MTVLDPAVGDLLIYRVTKYHANNPDNKWVNTYEFRVNEAGGVGTLLALGTKLVNFETALHHGNVVFDRLLISTWEADSVPYNPAVFINSTLTATGGRGGLADMVQLSSALSIVRQPASGRVGHIFIRGYLLEDDVSAPAGRTILNSRSDVQDDIDGALTGSSLEDHIGTDPEEGIQMVMINADGTQIRPVVQLRAQGVTNLPMDHAWFNRTTTP